MLYGMQRFRVFIRGKEQRFTPAFGNNAHDGHWAFYVEGGNRSVAKDVLDFINAVFLKASSLNQFAVPTKALLYCGGNARKS
jgi:hypothetical protein